MSNFEAGRNGLFKRIMSKEDLEKFYPRTEYRIEDARMADGRAASIVIEIDEQMPEAFERRRWIVPKMWDCDRYGNLIDPLRPRAYRAEYQHEDTLGVELGSRQWIVCCEVQYTVGGRLVLEVVSPDQATYLLVRQLEDDFQKADEYLRRIDHQDQELLFRWAMQDAKERCENFKHYHEYLKHLNKFKAYYEALAPAARELDLMMDFERYKNQLVIYLISPIAEQKVDKRIETVADLRRLTEEELSAFERQKFPYNDEGIKSLLETLRKFRLVAAQSNID